MTSKYQKLLEFYATREEALQAHVTRLSQAVMDRLRGPCPEARVTGRVKSLHSTYLKVLDRAMAVDEVRDLVGLRVIVGSERACYAAAERLQQAYETLPDGVRDYIARPKPNGYQSLHLQLRDPGQVDFEVQVRTRSMHVTAQTGSAAHYRYKAVSSAPLVNRWRLPDSPY